MSLNGSTGMVMIFGTIMAIAGGVQLGQLSAASPPFHYSNATPEERTAFLEREATPLRKQIKRALINPSGVGPSFYLKETKINAEHGRITFNIRVQGRMAEGAPIRAAKRKAYKQMCPGYLNSHLGRNEITVRQDFIGRNDETLLRISLSPSICGRYVVAQR
jgi:hypothetical protein